MKKILTYIKEMTITFYLMVKDIVEDEDLEILKPIGLFFIKPAWFVRSTMIYLVSPIFLVLFLVFGLGVYKEVVLIEQFMKGKIYE